MLGETRYFIPIPQYYWIIGELSVNIKKTNIKNDVCLHSDSSFRIKRAVFTCVEISFCI